MSKKRKRDKVKRKKRGSDKRELSSIERMVLFDPDLKGWEKRDLLRKAGYEA